MSEKAVTFDQQIEEVQREIRVRERVYEKRVENGTLRHDLADKQLAAMRATLATMKDMNDDEMSLPRTLFRLRTEKGLS